MTETIKVKIDRSSIKKKDNAYNWNINYVSGPTQSDGNGGWFRTVSPIYTLPGPSHCFKYESTLVTCPDCEAKFGHETVKEIIDSFGDDDYVTYSYYTCPNCSKTLDIIFEFERICDVVKEIKNDL